jgi:hypothetical protein
MWRKMLVITLIVCVVPLFGSAKKGPELSVVTQGTVKIIEATRPHVVNPASTKDIAVCYPQSASRWTGSTDGTAITDTSMVRGYDTEDGWMMFDVSSIPDGATINSIEFHFYVNSTNWPYWSCTPVTSDPLTADPATLYADINDEAYSGYYLYKNESSSYTTGWKTEILGGNANADLEAALAQDWFAIGIVSRDNSPYYYIIMDGWAQDSVPYLVVDYTPPGAPVHDVSVDALILYGWPWAVGETDTLEIWVTNNGNVTETNVPLHIEVGPFVSDVTIPTIDPGITESYFFEFSPSAEGVADILVYTSLPGDNNPFNDTLAWNEYFYPMGTVWAEGFEYLTSFPPPGWVVINNDGGSYTWDWYTGYPHTGANMTAVHWEVPNNDDWIITDAITPQTDYADSIGFFHAAYSSYWPEYLQVWAMSGQTVGDTLALLWEDDSITTTDYERVALSLDDFDGQTIYIAFRSLSADAYYNLLDDIFFFTIYSPTAVGEGIVRPERPTFSIPVNPIRDKGSVLFTIPKDMEVEIGLYDVSGRLTKRITSGKYTAGTHTIEFDVKSLSSGVYFVSFTAGERTLTHKIVVMK